MQLLVAVVNHEEHVDDVLAGFVELGITGATVLESKGMGRVLSREVPIFAGVRSLAARSRAENRTIFCVVSDDRAEAAMAMIQEVWGLQEDTDTRPIDNFIVRLRRYIEDDPTAPRHVQTVRGVGYRFVGDAGR